MYFMDCLGHAVLTYFEICGLFGWLGIWEFKCWEACIKCMVCGDTMWYILFWEGVWLWKEPVVSMFRIVCALLVVRRLLDSLHRQCLYVWWMRWRMEDLSLLSLTILFMHGLFDPTISTHWHTVSVLSLQVFEGHVNIWPTRAKWGFYSKNPFWVNSANSQSIILMIYQKQSSLCSHFLDFDIKLK